VRKTGLLKKKHAVHTSSDCVQSHRRTSDIRSATQTRRTKGETALITVANRMTLQYARAFEQRFRKRAGLVDQMPGFISNQILRHHPLEPIKRTLRSRFASDSYQTQTHRGSFPLRDTRVTSLHRSGSFCFKVISRGSSEAARMVLHVNRKKQCDEKTNKNQSHPSSANYQESEIRKQPVQSIERKRSSETK
jgi:heme oxygenase (mycobilin-producing)